MLQNIISNLFLIFVGALLLCCKSNLGGKNRNEVLNTTDTIGNCYLIQKFLSVGEDIFKPYADEYKIFLSEKNRFDLLVRQLGQRSKVIRITSVENEKDKLRMIKMSRDGKFESEIEFNFESVIPLISESGRVYQCNVASSDLGTTIYLLKIGGDLLVQIWVENGNYRHLTGDNKLVDKNLSYLEELLSLE